MSKPIWQQAEEWLKQRFPSYRDDASVMHVDVEVFLAGYAAGRRDGIEEAIKIAEDCGRSNVENPAIDMYERMRRSGIRWCGEFIVSRLRSLLNQPDQADSGGGN